MTPRTMRIAYQIYWLIQRTGGDCTVHDMAEATGESWQRCRAVCQVKGWQYRMISRTDDPATDGGRYLRDQDYLRSYFAREAGIEISGMVDA